MKAGRKELNDKRKQFITELFFTTSPKNVAENHNINLKCFKVLLELVKRIVEEVCKPLTLFFELLWLWQHYYLHVSSNTNYKSKVYKHKCLDTFMYISILIA